MEESRYLTFIIFLTLKKVQFIGLKTQLTVPLNLSKKTT